MGAQFDFRFRAPLRKCCSTLCLCTNATLQHKVCKIYNVRSSIVWVALQYSSKWYFHWAPTLIGGFGKNFSFDHLIYSLYNSVLDNWWCVINVFNHFRVERRTKAMQKSVKFTRAESSTEKDRVCSYIYNACVNYAYMYKYWTRRSSRDENYK